MSHRPAAAPAPKVAVRRLCRCGRPMAPGGCEPHRCSRCAVCGFPLAVEIAARDQGADITVVSPDSARKIGDLPRAVRGGNCTRERCSQQQECLVVFLGHIEEEPIPTGKGTVPRGHCSRCDRCGFPFAEPHEPGCQPGKCSQLPEPPLRLRCSRCQRRYPRGHQRKRLVAVIQTRLPSLEPELFLPERSLHPASITQREVDSWTMLAPGWDEGRPRTRDECRNGPRPCPWTSCSRHLYLEVNQIDGTIRLNHPDVPPDRMDLLPATCSLDKAEEMEAAGKWMTLEKVGKHLGMTLERARQIQEEALRKLAQSPEAIDVLAARLRLPILRS